MDRYFLYQLNFAGGNFYIGITKSPKRRLNDHMSDARRGSFLPVHNAIRKHGKPEMEILAEGSRDYIAQMEIRAIATFNPEYNISKGGDISPMLNEETRAKVAESMRQRFKDPEIRRRNSEAQKIAHNRPEAKALRSQLSKGRVASESTREKLRAINAGKKMTPDQIERSAKARTGQKRSDEAKQRMSEGQKRRVRSPEELDRLRVAAKGRVVTPEHREKLRVAALARWARARSESPE